VRATGRELAAQGSVDGVLKVLAQVGERLIDSKSGVVALFPGVVDDRVHLVAHSVEAPASALALANGTLFRMLRVTRKDLTRASVAVEPQFENVRAELLSKLDAFGAEIAVPMIDESERVVGLLALGPRAADEAFELDVVGALVQQAWESIERGKPVSVVFADLRGFTAFSDTVEPEEVTETLNDFHAAMGAHVSRWEGTLERFTGDGFIVFFNDPLEQRDHVERAARMTLDMRASVARLRDRWRLKGYPLDLGLHTGYATCGFIGYEGRRDHGVIGNVTNLAARFSEAAKGGEILTSARVRADLPDSIATETAGELTLDGFAEPQRAFRVLA